jgi:hypothetical protein
LGKNRKRPFFPAVLFSGLFFCTAPLSVNALEAALNFIPDNEGGKISVRVSGIDEDELRAHILMGSRSRIVYNIRLYREGRVMQILGDRLLFEGNPVQEARWDMYSASWEILHADGQRRFYTDWKTFFKKFMELDGFRVPHSIAGSTEALDGKLYVLARASFLKTVLKAPLSILQAFPGREEAKSPWSRLGLP